ncbi:MAG: hypothetical protein RJB10_969 [Pseudomonadota bacterium]|jgi:hypothetical protein
MSFSVLIESQRAIVAEIETELVLVAGNRELIRRMGGKVKAAYDDASLNQLIVMTVAKKVPAFKTEALIPFF